MILDVVVPAYNEENTIADTIQILKQVSAIQNIIVVNDCSTDKTSIIAHSIGVAVVDLPCNLGKGGAMKMGAIYSQADYILFIDADLIGLQPYHIKELIDPILNRKYESSIGLFANGGFFTDLAQKIAPFLSGQRVIKRDIIIGMGSIEKSRYGVEVTVTKYIKKNKITCKKVYLPNLTHVVKEEKLGIIKGFMARLKMYWEIAKVLFGT